MKKKRFSEEQMVSILREADTGVEFTKADIFDNFMSEVVKQERGFSVSGVEFLV